MIKGFNNDDTPFVKAIDNGMKTSIQQEGRRGAGRERPAGGMPRASNNATFLVHLGPVL